MIKLLGLVFSTGVVTAAIALMGWLYWLGYLASFSVPAEVFPLDQRALLLQGYLAAAVAVMRLPTVSDALGLMLLIAGGYGLFGLLIARSTHPDSVAWGRRLRDRLRLRVASAKTSSTVLGVATSSFVLVLMTSTLVMIPSLVLSPAFGYVLGKRQADIELSRVQRTGCQTPSKELLDGCVQVTFRSGTVVAGHYIASNEKAIALWREGKALVYYEERSSVMFGNNRPSVSGPKSTR